MLICVCCAAVLFCCCVRALSAAFISSVLLGTVCVACVSVEFSVVCGIFASVLMFVCRVGAANERNAGV